MLSSFEYIGDSINILSGQSRKVYKYRGTGYFPEVVERLRNMNKLNITYVDVSSKTIHIEEIENKKEA